MREKMREKRKKKGQKDRVLNTRIPAELDQLLRERADTLDMPVSQLVRNILHCTVDLVGNLSGNVENLVAEMVEDVSAFKKQARGAIGAETPNAVDELVSAVIGWQEIRVNQTGRCAISSEALEVGDTAHLGIRTDGKPPVLVSNDSLTAILAKRSAAAAWSKMQLNKETVCCETGRRIEAGELAYFRDREGGLEIISSEAFLKRPSANLDPAADARTATAATEPE